MGIEPDDIRFAQTRKWSGDTLILRAGLSTVETLRGTEPDSDWAGIIVYSCQAREGATADELLVGDDGSPLFSSRKYRTTTLGRLRREAADPNRCLAETTYSRQPVPLRYRRFDARGS
jgi:hypothetical protein